ncbi:MAG: hypothetical protein CR993_07475 [Rhodobacterales bacterium]|nr:MAG: hypothetical protein CR993_07475 [Rhodobacterales bacterium]
MLVIALTSIPPRFPALPKVFAALARQGADRLALTIPRSYRRFAPAPLPELPGVEVIRTETDLGPAGKLLAPARAYPQADILYCDDDWHYADGWADALRMAYRPGSVAAAALWPIARLKRRGLPVVQGFAGAIVPGEIAARIPTPAGPAWWADDLWLSGHFWAAGLTPAPATEARALATPLPSPGALQDTARAQDNRTTAAQIHAKLRIWPEASP